MKVQEAQACTLVTPSHSGDSLAVLLVWEFRTPLSREGLCDFCHSWANVSLVFPLVLGIRYLYFLKEKQQIFKS